MSIPEISKYYHDGEAFVIRNTTKKVRVFLAIMFSIFVLSYSGVISVSYEQTQEYTEDVIETDIHPAVMYIQKTNSNVSNDDAIKIVDSSIKWGSKFGVDPSLLLAIAKVESTYDKYAISHAGAFGILQVLPKWHIDKIKAAKKELGTPEMFDIDANIYVGAQIIKDCKKRYGDLNTSLKCFNGSVGMKTSYDSDVIRVQKEIKNKVSI